MINFGHGVMLGAMSDNCDSGMYRLWRNDYAIWKWCRQHTVIDRAAHERWLKKILEDPSIKMFEIVTSYNSAIGVCGFTDIDRLNQRAEFSLYIAPAYQGKGYAKAALKTLFSHGFMNQNFHVIWGETFDGNKAYNLFLDLGMKHEGVRRDFYFKDGHFINAHLISLTRDDYWGLPWSNTKQC